MSYSVTWNSGFSFAKTLSAKHELKACPFNRKSLKPFVTDYNRSLADNNNSSSEEHKNNNYNNNNNNNDGGSSGSYSFKYALVSNAQEMNDALNIGVKLQSSYGPVSGDAEVNFAMKNTQSSMSVSLVICAQQTGRVVKNTNYDMQLELSEVVKKLIAKNQMTVQQFTQKYGKYLIIGVEYGGKAVFTTHFKTASELDKKQTEARLRVQYGKLGFSVGGEVSGKHARSKLQTNVSSTFDYQLYPSATNDLTTSVIRTLASLAHPETVDVDDDDDDDEEGEELQIKLSTIVQKLLSGNTLDPINVIFIPLLTIKCVSDAFTGVQAIGLKCWKPFYGAMNPLYQSLQRMVKDFEIIDRCWHKKKRTAEVNGMMKKWRILLPRNVQQMQICEVTDVQPKYEAFISSPIDYLLDTAEITKPFYEMNTLQLETEFRDEILEKYNEYLLLENAEEEDDEDDEEDEEEDHEDVMEKEDKMRKNHPFVTTRPWQPPESDMHSMLLRTMLGNNNNSLYKF